MSTEIRTDSDVLKLARRIDRHMEAAHLLWNQLRDCEHPNAADIVEAVDDEAIVYLFASVENIVKQHLLKPRD